MSAIMGKFQGIKVYKTTLPEYVNMRLYRDKENMYMIDGEIIYKNEIYATWDGQYVNEIDPQNRGVYYTVPAISEEKIKEVQEKAVKAYKAWGCSGLARVDFFVRYSDGAVLLNEPNTLPGFTNISMYPMLMEKAGFSYGDLIDKLCILAIEKWEKEFAQ